MASRRSANSKCCIFEGVTGTLGPKMKPTWAPGGAENCPKISPEKAQNGSPEASGRPLGGPWTALGGSLGAKADFRAFLGALGDPFWGLKNQEKLSWKLPEIGC